jgi:hypothetical protein
MAAAGFDSAAAMGLKSNLARMAPLPAHSDPSPPAIGPRPAQMAPLDINPKGDVSAPATQMP